MRHKRDFARITTVWKKAKTQADINASAVALLKRHGEPIEILPENWTSVTVQFRKKYGNDLRDEELPSQYAQGRAAGSRDRHSRSGRTRKPQARSDKAVWNYNLIPNSRSKLAGPERARPPEERGTASQVRGRERTGSSCCGLWIASCLNPILHHFPYHRGGRCSRRSRLVPHGGFLHAQTRTDVHSAPWRESARTLARDMSLPPQGICRNTLWSLSPSWVFRADSAEFGLLFSVRCRVPGGSWVTLRLKY